MSPKVNGAGSSKTLALKYGRLANRPPSRAGMTVLFGNGFRVPSSRSVSGS